MVVDSPDGSSRSGAIVSDDTIAIEGVPSLSDVEGRDSGIREAVRDSGYEAPVCLAE